MSIAIINERAVEKSARDSVYSALSHRSIVDREIENYLDYLEDALISGGWTVERDADSDVTYYPIQVDDFDELGRTFFRDFWDWYN